MDHRSRRPDPSRHREELALPLTARLHGSPHDFSLRRSGFAAHSRSVTYPGGRRHGLGDRKVGWNWLLKPSHATLMGVTPRRSALPGRASVRHALDRPLCPRLCGCGARRWRSAAFPRGLGGARHPRPWSRNRWSIRPSGPRVSCADGPGRWTREQTARVLPCAHSGRPRRTREALPEPFCSCSWAPFSRASSGSLGTPFPGAPT